MVPVCLLNGFESSQGIVLFLALSNMYTHVYFVETDSISAQHQYQSKGLLSVIKVIKMHQVLYFIFQINAL